MKVILTLLLFYSCTRYAEIDKTAMGLAINGVAMNIHQLEDVEWQIGKRKESSVSQSFTFIVQMPKLQKKDLRYLEEHQGANAWIIRLIQVKGSEASDLGSVYTLFKPKQVTRGLSEGPVVNIAIKVYYAATYPSERFRHFQCPAFGHDKELTALAIKGETSPISIPLGAPVPYGERSQLVQLSPSSFNGGHDLTADYYVEIAPYNSVKKEILAPFKRIPRYIEVGEKRVDVGACKGIHPELN